MARKRTTGQRRARRIKRLWAQASRLRSIHLARQIIANFGGACPRWARDGVADLDNFGPSGLPPNA